MEADNPEHHIVRSSKKTIAPRWLRNLQHKLKDRKH